MGNEAVTKSFALPKIVYPSTVLANPTNDTINEIENVEFLWDEKQDR